MRLFRVHRPSPAMAVACLSLVLSLSGVTYAATGGTFVLGHANSAGNPTGLSSGTTAGPSLKVANTGHHPAASFTTASGVAPFTVNRTTKVGHLNADLLDGLSSASFVRASQLPAAAVFNSAAESTNTATLATLTADSERFDQGNLFDLASPSLLVAHKTGVYYVAAVVDWTANANGGYRNTTIAGPASEAIATAIGPQTSTTAFTTQNVSGIAFLTAGQSVSVTVLQGSGVSVNARLTRFEMAYLGT
jgi:hypothetical protein